MFQAIYQKWCKSSMLPEDSRERRLQATSGSSATQSQVDGHFQVLKPDEKPLPYSDELFHEAATQWLIETDQVRNHAIIVTIPLLAIC